jgi:signal transduction histidine kinase
LIPFAVLLGAGLERLFMYETLAMVVNQLARPGGPDPQAVIARALNDPSLKIAYPRPALGSYVFLQAVGAAAVMHLENAQLEADLRASTGDLAASRARLVEAAHAERRRIERDLHDGVQQQLVGLRISLDLAGELIKEEPVRGERMIAAIGVQLDEAVEALCSLARGIYPAVLHEYGLGEALKSVACRSPVPVSIRASGVRRYPEDTEIAVYFCCLEALQNQQGSGLLNMRDRIEAVGGALVVVSRRGRGTSVRGSVPVPGSVH